MYSWKLIAAFGRKAAAFNRDNRGNFTIVAAAVILPLLLMIGMAVDYTGASKVRSRLQNAVDAATLAASKAVAEGITDESKLQKIAQDALASNFAGGASGGELTATLSYDPDKNIVNVVASAPSSTSFMRLINVEKIDVGADAQAVIAGTDAEVTMVLDVTGSMGGSKIYNLRTAATSLVDILLPKPVSDEDAKIRVAMVPYAASVNVGTAAKAKITKPGKDKWNKFFPKVKSKLKADPAYSGSKKDAIDDYIENMKDGYAFSSSYTCVTERIGNKAYTDKSNFVANPILDMNNGCPNAEVVPLTANAGKLKTEISNLSASGWTAGHIGLSFGWYTLSRNMAKRIWPANKKPAKYNDDVLKILVLMSDGSFNTWYVGQSSSTQALTSCDAIKQQGVLIYTVGFKAPPSALTMLKNCASNTTMFFDVKSGAELEAVFKRIASETRELRLSM